MLPRASPSPSSISISVFARVSSSSSLRERLISVFPFERMVFTSYVKQRILSHYLRGHCAPTIACLLREESLAASRSGVDRFLKKFEETKCISRTPGSGRPTKATAEIKAIIEQKMHEDDETTAYQLHQLLITRGYNITLQTVLRCRTSLGWTI